MTNNSINTPLITLGGPLTTSGAFSSTFTMTGTTSVTFPTSGTLAVAGSQTLVQRVSTETGAAASGTTVIPYDNTIPQNTEGDQYMTLAITPLNSADILVIEITLILGNSAVNNLIAALFQDSTANALAAASNIIATIGNTLTLSFKHIMTAGTTSSTTFKVRAGAGTASTTYFNSGTGGSLFNGVCASSILITEYTS